MIKWIKNKIIWFLFGGVCLASGVVLLPEKTITEIEKPVVVKDEPTYFAELDKEGTVLRVIVADQDFINTGKVGNPNNWVQTYMDNSKRKNYAGKGYKYDNKLDAFISKKPSEDATLDEITTKWIIPKVEVVITETATTTTK